MIMIFHQAVRVYMDKHLALSLVLAFLNDVVRGTPHVIEYIHVVYEANEVAASEKHIPLLYAAVDDVIVIHPSIVAPIKATPCLKWVLRGRFWGTIARMTFWKSLFGDEEAAALKRAESIVAPVNALESAMQALSDDELRAKKAEFRARLTAEKEGGETLDALAPEAFAAVREASVRTLKQRHFDVQLVGGMVLHQGGIAEMRTGEGKTLVATLPAYLNALAGGGVHVVTVNDYLSRRDAVWMGQIYHALGLSVGVINHEASFIYDPSHMPSEVLAKEDTLRDQIGSFKVEQDFLRPCTRREAYAADITYGTNNEFGFDYLRDNLEYEPEKLRQHTHHFAIVDEIDSILIDEARTPLIISAPVADAESLYERFTAIARSLEREADYTVEEKHKQIILTDAGIEKAQAALGVGNIYTDAGIKYVHHLETAVRAKALFQRDKDYVVKDGQVVIVDEFTGRLQPGRRWSEGLHQAIESKEGV